MKRAVAARVAWWAGGGGFELRGPAGQVIRDNPPRRSRISAPRVRVAVPARTNECSRILSLKYTHEKECLS
jgi:hypothetical protein